MNEARAALVLCHRSGCVVQCSRERPHPVATRLAVVKLIQAYALPTSCHDVPPQALVEGLVGGLERHGGRLMLGSHVERVLLDERCVFVHVIECWAALNCDPGSQTVSTLVAVAVMRGLEPFGRHRPSVVVTVLPIMTGAEPAVWRCGAAAASTRGRWASMIH
jgi:hypothetical protein